jgi:hypothetical protein
MSEIEEKIKQAMIDRLGDQWGCNSDRCACFGAEEVMLCKMGISLESLIDIMLKVVRDNASNPLL